MVRIQEQDPPCACKTEVRCPTLFKQNSQFQWHLKSVLQSVQMLCRGIYFTTECAKIYNYRSTKSKEPFSEIIHCTEHLFVAWFSN